MNLTGVKPEDKVKPKPITTPKQIHRGVNKNLMRMRLASQQDDLEGDDVGSPASPHVREITDGNESYGYDYGRGIKFRYGSLRNSTLIATLYFLDGLSLQSSIDPELRDVEALLINQGALGNNSSGQRITPSQTPSTGPSSANPGAPQLSRRAHSGGHGGHGLSRSRSGRGIRPYSHPSHTHGKSGDHSITQFALMDDENVSALQQITRGGGGLTLASQWKSQFDDSEETDNEWKGEHLQSPEHKFSFSQAQYDGETGVFEYIEKGDKEDGKNLLSPNRVRQTFILIPSY